MLDQTPEHGLYQLRPATAHDFDFLWELKQRTLREHIEALFGWDEELARRSLEERVMPGAQIVESQGASVGLLKVGEEKGWLTIHEIGLLPEWQGRGLGTRILSDVLAHAEREGLTVELQVLTSNLGARRLYEGMGFVVSHYRMFRPRPGR